MATSKSGKSGQKAAFLEFDDEPQGILYRQSDEPTTWDVYVGINML